MIIYCKKYNTIWDKINANIKGFDSEPIYNENFFEN